MTKTRRIVSLFSLFLALQIGVVAGAAAGDFQLIVNSANPISSIQADAVNRIMLGKTTRWEHGPQIEPVDQTQRSSTRATFSKQILRKSVASVKSYWQSQIFSGRGVPPAELDSNAAVIDFVKGHSNAIGYVSAKTPVNIDGIKVVEVTR